MKMKNCFKENLGQLLRKMSSVIFIISFLRFLNLTVTIYSISGEKIFEKKYLNTDGKLEFLLTEELKRDLASGIYIFQFEDEDNNINLKKIAMVK